MQLVAYGAQDIYLTGTPMITFFKVVYRRHTNFAMESIQQTLNGTVGWGNKVTCLISRNGDLLSGLTLEATLPAAQNADSGAGTDRWIDGIGHYIIDEVSVEIGGQQIDKHYGDWLEIWAQLTVPAGKEAGYREMIGQLPSGGSDTSASVQQRREDTEEKVIYVPLQFWFCRNVGLALPLIALQYHEVKVNLTFAAATNKRFNQAGEIATVGASLATASIWADYIYLDTDERRRFAQVSHEYLIEQVQRQTFTGTDATAVAHTLNFNHPVKELVWVTRGANNHGNNYTNRLSVTDDVDARPGLIQLDTADGGVAESAVITNLAVGCTASAILKLNGHQRFASRGFGHFNLEQTFRHHTNVPVSPGVYVYSFALKPEEHQPSGTCNFSRIDNAQLEVTYVTSAVGTLATQVYAVNYNVLRIMSGMGGLAYSN